MQAVDYIPVVVGIFVVAVIWVMLADYFDTRKVARCIRWIGTMDCPQCKQVLGADSASAAKQRMIKFTSDGFKRLRGRDYPSRLISVTCPRCQAKLDFRLDGSLFSCDHKIIAEQVAKPIPRVGI